MENRLLRHTRLNYFYWVLCFIFIITSSIIGYIGWKSSMEAKVIVEWSTASELNTVGFYLYRSESPNGSFEKITRDLIPSSVDPLTGGSYSYTDQDVKPGMKYYYLLEEVEMEGNTNRHGPIIVEAKGGGKFELGLATVSGLVGIIGIIRGIVILVNSDSQNEPDQSK